MNLYGLAFDFGNAEKRFAPALTARERSQPDLRQFILHESKNRQAPNG
jgi:hypothetical protein